jgi:hypothetical protein
MEATVNPLPRGPDWMPITPKTGSLFHADSQSFHNCLEDLIANSLFVCRCMEIFA